MEALENVSRQALLYKPTSVINHLPIEILALVLTYVAELDASRRSRASTGSFPFNMASTCPFWMDILKSTPANWQSISIDVMDPTPFLDTFSMFTGGPIDVFVFSSIKKLASQVSKAGIPIEDARKCYENRQARIILDHLEPHIKRCASVTFDLVFQSSLPCATDILARSPILSRSPPHLEKLVLKCLKYDVDDDENKIEINIDRYDLQR